MYSSKHDFYNPILIPPEHHKVKKTTIDNLSQNSIINNNFCHKNNPDENGTTSNNNTYIQKQPKMHNMNQYLATKRLLHYPIPINYNNPDISVDRNTYLANSLKYNPSTNYYYVDEDYCNLNINNFPPVDQHFDAPQCTTLTYDYNRCPLRRNSVKPPTNLSNLSTSNPSNPNNPSNPITSADYATNNAYYNTRGYIRYGKFLSTESNVYLNSPIWRKSVNMEGRDLMRRGYNKMYKNVDKIIRSTDQFMQDI